jgi:preprotein translocase subunit SecG
MRQPARSLPRRTPPRATVAYLPLWGVAILVLIAGTLMHHSPSTRSMSTVLSVSSELLFACLTLASGFRRPARWMTAVMAGVWLVAGAWEILLQWLPVWTAIAEMIAIGVAAAAWYHLVLRERGAATGRPNVKIRKTRGRS